MCWGSQACGAWFVMAITNQEKGRENRRQNVLLAGNWIVWIYFSGAWGSRDVAEFPFWNSLAWNGRGT
jgi:hypothetical protein